MLTELYFTALTLPHHPSKEVISFKKMISSAIYKNLSQMRIYFILLRKLRGKDLCASDVLVTIYLKSSFTKSKTVDKQIPPIPIVQNILLRIYFTTAKADTVPLNLSATLADQNKIKILIISSFTVW